MTKFRTAMRAGAAALALAGAAAASAGETITYRYDALGRLIQATSTGSINDQLYRQYVYDRAGNRRQTALGTGTPPAFPPPEPLPPNQAPVTAADTLSVPRCGSNFKNVTANDSDPEDHLPLALVSVSAGTLGAASVFDGDQVFYEAGSSAGTDVLTYTVEDSLGAASNGTLTVTVLSQGSC